MTGTGLSDSTDLVIIQHDQLGAAVSEVRLLTAHTPVTGQGLGHRSGTRASDT